MTSTFACPECGEATEMTTKVASGFKCDCTHCGCGWMSDDKGNVMETPTEPDGRAHKLRLGQRTGQVAVLASKDARSSLNLLTETPGDTTSWAMAIKKRRKPVAHDAIQRDSTELGPTAPAAKSQVSNYYSMKKPMDSIISQARELVNKILERQKHTCSRCGGDGEVEVEGEGKVTCPSCMGSGEVRRRQNRRQEADQSAHHALWDQAVAAAEKAGQVSGQMMLIDFVAELYNGGVQQYIEHGKASEYAMVIRYLRTLDVPQAQDLANRMANLESSVHEAEQAEQEAISNQRHGQEYEESPFEAYENDFGILEDWVYNEANIDPILSAMVGEPGEVPVQVESGPEPEGSFALRPMTPEELQGFQGAEEGPNGEPPLVGEKIFNGQYDGMVIVDRNGVQVHFDAPGGQDGGYTHHGFFFPTPYAQGKGIAQLVSRMKNVNELVQYGFEEI